ncbi:hypothetical protein IEQ34_004200 [Dendrobium chrysotoxum]|uniref:Uncharacterized protein n=1 Tax=Dendrobium chrysotoxum TaxID=161865 RepID=A0AAV7HDN6_DENCH|nr:hypothetical protein IEQ34_004200 [Dendrobium chrysotoxum]
MEKPLGYINYFFPLLLIYFVLKNVTDEEVEQLGVDLNALQNKKSVQICIPSNFIHQTQKIHTSPPHFPHSPHVEPPQSSPQSPTQPSSQPATRPPTEQPLATKWFTVQNKLMKAYRGYKQVFEIFIQYINPDSVRKSKLIVQPICFKGHLVLIIGRLKDKVWKLYDLLPNPEYKAICTEVIKQIHEDKAGVFPSDITTWKL